MRYQTEPLDEKGLAAPSSSELLVGVFVFVGNLEQSGTIYINQWHWALPLETSLIIITAMLSPLSKTAETLLG